MDKRPITGFDKGFACGVTYASAMIIKMHDQPVIALDILKSSGVDILLADKYDRDIIKLHLRQ